MLLASTSTKRGQSDGSAIPMGAPIKGGGTFPTSTIRELLRLPALPRLPELPLSLLSVIRQQAAGSRAYVLGRSPDWLKMKNANAPAVKREAEENWGEERWR